jgi:hypothetical protein
VVYTHVGRRHELLIIAYIKHAIERCSMARAERALLLQKLNALPDGSLTVEMLATIQPMSDIEVEMMHEARSLDPKDDKLGQASFEMLTDLRVFSLFLNLNPSLLTAIKMRPMWFCRGGRKMPDRSNIQRIILLSVTLLVGGVEAAFAQQQVSNLVSGSGNATTTGQTTIIPAPNGTRRLYIRSIECGRTDAGTTAISVSFNDDASSVMVVPNSGGGGGNTLSLGSPLTVPAATAFKFTASAGVSTLYCNAQGFSGD